MDITTGYENTLIGTFAGGNLDTGIENVMMGQSAGGTATGAASMTLIGFRAGLDSVLLAASINAKSGEKVFEIGAGVGTVLFCLMKISRGLWARAQAPLRSMERLVVGEGVPGVVKTKENNVLYFF